MTFEEFKNKYKIKNENYYELIKELLNHEKVKEMDTYIQHGKTTTLDHCIKVSYKSYRLAKLLHFDYKSAARAGLLHDFFLYDWHKMSTEGQKLFEMHGYTHPTTALNNANKYFKLNKREKDIIVKHMWPLTLLHLPRYKESVIVSLMDKTSTIDEFINPKAKKVAKFALLLIGVRLK